MSNEENERIFVDFEPNDFILRISPVLDDDDVWTGELNVGYMTVDENYMNDDDYQHVDLVANMAISAIPLMEENKRFRKMLYDYTLSVLKPEEKQPVTVHDDSNVIKLRFQ